jgi:tRNA threonylcarbamoyl adenosine modification protein YeaZ
MSDRVIVAMDGSTHASTAALLGRDPRGAPADWHVLARRIDTDPRGQARVLLRLLDDMLEEIGRGPEDIAALVAGIGPGTFTGVRIAVATARALALALDVPVIGISTLSTLVAEVAARSEADGTAPEVIAPIADARRGQVFYGVYRRVEGGAYARSEAFGVVDRGALLSVVPAVPSTLVVGDIAVLGEEAGVGEAGLRVLEVRAENLIIGQGLLREPGDGVEGALLEGWLAAAVEGAKRAGDQKAGEPGSPEGVKPIYVRSPDADIHITKMRDPWAAAAPER